MFKKIFYKMDSFYDKFWNLNINKSTYYDTKTTILIIDTKPSKNTICSILNTMWFFPHFPVLFYTNLNNMKKEFYEKLSNKKITILNSHITINNRTDYDLYLKSKKLWQSINTEKTLIIQHDTFVRRTGIEEFYSYDYIGAIWRCPEEIMRHHPVGNGGFSLRSTRIMEHLCNKHFSSKYYEDVYFSYRCLTDGFNLAPIEAASKFSCETVFSENPLGCHQIWNWLTDSEIEHLTNFFI